MSDIRDIEKQAAAERNILAKSIDDLSQTVAPENLTAHAGAWFERYGQDLGRQTLDAARANPAAFALVGAGVALLLSGASKRTVEDARSDDVRALPRANSAEASLVGFDERVRAADAAMRPQEPSASWLREKLEEGLDRLPPEARIKVRNARIKAIEAQEAVESQARRVAKATQSGVRRQPLAFAAVAAAAGAIVASVLPGTRREDALLGETRDRAMAAAQAHLRHEMDKAAATARRAIHDAGKPRQNGSFPTASR